MVTGDGEMSDVWRTVRPGTADRGQEIDSDMVTSVSPDTSGQQSTQAPGRGKLPLPFLKPLALDTVFKDENLKPMIEQDIGYVVFMIQEMLKILSQIQGRKIKT